jgi:hypothetical protein
VPAGHLRVVLGTDYTTPSTLGTLTVGDSPRTTPTPPAPASPNHSAADPTNSISGTEIPCVK